MSFYNIPGALDSTSVGTGGDLVTALTPFLGPPNQHARIDIDMEGRNPATTYNLPQAYIGKNVTLETLLEHEMVSKSLFYGKILPYKKSDSPNLRWTSIQYQNSFFEVAPFGAPPNYITSTREAHSDRMLNRSMGFEISHGFWKTEEGQEQYRKNFEVLESSARLTIYQLIISALLQSKNEYRNWEMRYKTSVTTIAQALRRRKLTFAVLNRSAKLFVGLQADAADTMKLNGSDPNMWILPPKTKILLTHMHDSETEYSSSGSYATEVRKKGANAVDTIRGVELHETNIFSHIVDGGQANPLRRIREYGSFFTITNYHKSSSLDDYRNEDRFSAKILDASKDAESKVSGRDLFRLSGRFESDGSLSRNHYTMISESNLNDLKRRMEQTGSDNKYLDMFIGYDVTRTTTNQGLFVMDYFGDMWEQDVTDEAILDHAKTAANKLYTNKEFGGLSADNLRDINSIGQFMHDLNRIDITNRDHSRYLKAVALSAIPGGANQAVGGIFKPDSHGSIVLPLITPEHGLHGTIANVSGPLVFNDEANTVTILQNPGPNIASNVGTFNTPLGMGSPAGLKTLSAMHRGGSRGYDKDILKRAHEHYELLEKVFAIWDKLYPGNELGEERACPVYFRSGDSTANRIYAFCLNLYDKARYPSFIRVPTVDRGTASFAAVARDAAPTDVLPDDRAGFIVTKFGQTAAFWQAFYNGTDSAEAKASLLNDKAVKQMEVSYRSKQYKRNGDDRVLTLAEFINYILTKTTDVNRIKCVTGILEILLRNTGAVDWEREISAAIERPIRVSSVVRTPAATENPSVSYVNCRLCFLPEIYKSYADIIESTEDPANVPDILIRPMNVLNPTRPLGEDHTNLGRFSEIKYAAAPNARNTINSLTISPFHSKHLEQASNNKRGNDSLYSSSSSKRTRQPGGIFMPRTNTRETMLEAIPNGSLFGEPNQPHARDSNTSHIPMNIALDQAYNVFSFEADHSHYAGGPVSRYFRHGLISRFHRFAQEANGIYRIMAQSWLTTKIHLNAFKVWWAQDCIPLVSFELWRLRQRYYMGTGLLLQGGDQLGAAYHGFHDFQWADDVIKKVHVGHYTFMFCATVKQPSHIMRCEDIVAMGYIGGESNTFIESPEDFQTLIRDPDNAYGHMYTKMVPYCRELPVSPQDAAGIYNRTIVAQCSVDGMSEQNPIHGESSYFYNHVYGLDRINAGLATRDAVYRDTTGSVNTIAWRGHHRIYNVNKQDWSTIIPDDGLFGNNVYSGCVADRDISGGAIKDMQFSSNCEIYA